jgi:hypothetical protein
MDHVYVVAPTLEVPLSVIAGVVDGTAVLKVTIGALGATKLAATPPGGVPSTIQ